MAGSSNNVNQNSKDGFSALSFERKLVELVEELRLRRNLEIESENTLKAVMDEKYKEELNWDEQHRRHIREKDDLEQQIELLKRKLEDKVCVSDDDKVKQEVMNRTYSHELRMLKEELRISKSEKLNLQKRVQELEGKLSLHNNFQESIVSQMNEVRKTMRSIQEEGQQLMIAQKDVMENVVAAKLLFRKLDLCTRHLQKSMAIVGKKSETMQKELVSSRCELTLLKQSVPNEKKTSKNDAEVEKLQNKILDLEYLLLLSHKENEQTLSNFVQSNEMLCKFTEKYLHNRECEKTLEKDVERVREKLEKKERELRETTEEMEALKQKEKGSNQRTLKVQTDEEFISNVECYSYTGKKGSSNIDLKVAVFEEKDSDNENARIEVRHFQQDPVLENGFVPDVPICSREFSSADEGTTLSIGMSKRKMGFLVESSEDNVEWVSSKKRSIQNGTDHVISVMDGTGENQVPLTSFDVKFDIDSRGTETKKGETRVEIPKRQNDLSAFVQKPEEKCILEI